MILDQSTLEETVSTSVAEPPVAAKPKHHTFYSRRRDLRLVIEKGYELKDPQGLIRESIQGKRVAFDEGKLAVPFKGQMRGEKGELLDAEEVLVFLVGDEAANKVPHMLFGDREEGFWLAEEPAPVPTAEEHDALAELAMNLDVEGIERFIAAEEAGWAREDLLNAARAQLERVVAKAAEHEAAVEAARAEGAAAAKPAGRSQ